MSFWRPEEGGVDPVMRDSLIVLVPVAATCAVILLWFFG